MTTQDERHEEMTRILDELVEAIETEGYHGRLFHDDEGFVCAEAAPLDLGLAYLRACAVLGRQPILSPKNGP